MVISDSHILIKTEEDLGKLLSEYGVSSVDELASCLWFDYGITLIDNRPLAEFSQVNAQHSPEFFNEEMTQDEYNQILESKKIYGTS